MRVVVAPDKFRGTVSAREAAAAMGRAVEAAGHEAVLVPVADGGEGLLDVLGGPNRMAVVRGPLGAPVEAAWRMGEGTAVIEMALASGLALVGGPDANDPIAADTVGTGELIRLAVESGARRVIVGLGGSATVDGGLGALRAMAPLSRFRAVDLLVACDVRTTFLDAAEVFGPQKGATAAQVRLLANRLARLADVYEQDHGVDVRDLPGSGAAGGLAGGLAAIGAELVDGFSLVAEELDLYDLIDGADLVLTGEGFLDAESFNGKVVGGVAEIAAASGVRAAAVVGQALDGMDQRIETVALLDRYGADAAFDTTGSCIEAAVTDLLATAAP